MSNTFTKGGPNPVRLVNTTAQQLLAGIAPNSVDLILTDPPYIISQETGFRNATKDGLACGGNPSFAITMDYGAWDRDGFTMEDLAETVSLMFPAMKPGASAVIFFDIWKSSDLARLMLAAGFENVTMIDWLKTNAVPINSRKTYLSNAREIAVVGVKPGKAPIFNRDAVHPDSAAGLFKFPIYAGKDRFHPTQKSLPMFEEMIRLLTNPGDMVLDCFSGSATTGVAAIRTGRGYVGAEPDADYFEKSSSRLRDCR